jgi:hypothetical protein
MIRATTIISFALLLSACDSKPLTEMECQTLTNMELDFATEGAGEDAESMRDFLANAAEAGTAKCVDGKTYTRSDYKCLLRATSRSEKNECFSEVTARIRK